MNSNKPEDKPIRNKPEDKPRFVAWLGYYSMMNPFIPLVSSASRDSSSGQTRNSVSFVQTDTDVPTGSPAGARDAQRHIVEREEMDFGAVSFGYMASGGSQARTAVG